MTKKILVDPSVNFLGCPVVLKSSNELNALRGVVIATVTDSSEGVVYAKHLRDPGMSPGCLSLERHPWHLSKGAAVELRDALGVALEQTAAREQRAKAGEATMAEGVLAELLSEAPEGSLGFVISQGAPCVCGPGFCWKASEIGGYGYDACDREKGEPAPDCPHCTAPGQGRNADGRLLCWNCCEFHEAPFRLTEPVEPYHKKAADKARAWMAKRATE